MVFLGKYSNIISLTTIYLSQVSAIFFLGILSIRCFSWLTSRPSINIAMYAAGFMMILVLSMISIPYLTNRLQDKIPMVEPRPYRIVKLSEAIPSPEVEYAHLLGYYIFAALIITTWVVSVSLLRHYSRTTGKIKFWAFVSLPLVYLFIQTVALRLEWGWGGIKQTLEIVFLFQVTNQLVGVFFGMTFWITARRIKKKILKNSLITVAVRIILMFSSVEVGLILLPVYPPFGLITLAFAGLASFMLMSGIINTASMVAKDTDLRRELLKSISGDSNFLSSMGQAEWRREIERTIEYLVDRSKESEEEQQRFELEPDEVERVIDEVLTELGKKPK
jgi:uncharacterized protein YneF (UPF0154 family)